MTDRFAPQTPPDPFGVVASFTNPAPGYRLVFVSIPRFLAECLTKAIPDDFRTSPPLDFADGDFQPPFLGADELAMVNRFRALKKQVEWMAGRYAAKVLARHCLPDRPAPESIRVGYRTKGAPFFTADPPLSLSISHARDFAAAGMSLQPRGTLGIDLEYMRPASRSAILNTAFSTREAADLEHRDDAALFLRWTAKEAYLKFIGMGFHESLKRIEIIDDAIYRHGRPVIGVDLRSYRPFPGYAFSIVWAPQRLDKNPFPLSMR